MKDQRRHLPQNLKQEYYRFLKVYNFIFHDLWVNYAETKVY